MILRLNTGRIMSIWMKYILRKCMGDFMGVGDLEVGWSHGMLVGAHSI